MSQVMQQVRGSTETLSAFAVWDYRILISSMLPWQKLETFKLETFKLETFISILDSTHDGDFNIFLLVAEKGK